jgi:hypothetical protein
LELPHEFAQRGAMKKTAAAKDIKLCECGCGQPAPIAKWTDKRRGYVEGQPQRFIKGHHRRGQSRPLAVRFWERVDKNGPMPSVEAVAVHPQIAGQPCWLYTGQSHRGYGRVRRDDGREVRAHHVAWFLATGRWPDLCVLHRCDVRNCVRFEHLFRGSKPDNVADMVAKGRDRFDNRARVTAGQAAEIRRVGQPWLRSGRGRHRRGTITLLRQIARRFGVDRRAIRSILENGTLEGT